MLASDDFARDLNRVALISDFASDLENCLYLIQTADPSQLAPRQQKTIDLWLNMVEEIAHSQSSLGEKAAFDEPSLTGAAEIARQRVSLQVE